VAVSAFKDVVWNANEYISTDKLNTMVSNTRYLFERAPKLYYNAYSVKKDSGLKIACGTITVAASKSKQYARTVSFGTFFTVGCKPVIVTSITSATNRRLTITQYGIQGANYVPDHRGFIGVIAVATTEKNHYLTKQAYINWIAMGY
jgi:hypothetical protein